MESAESVSIADAVKAAQDLMSKLESLKIGNVLKPDGDASQLWLALRLLEQQILPYMYQPEGYKDPYLKGRCPKCGQKVPT